jgi:hypothetical protein
MATALVILEDAHRESNITPMGATLNATQITESLRRLKALIASALGDDIGHPLEDWPVGVANYDDSMSGWSSADWAYPRSNVRLVLNIDSVQSIYLPFQPEDGARIALVDSGGNLATYNVTVYGNGRKVEGAASVTLSTDGESREWFYRADLGDWKLVSELADETVDMPFPSEFDDYWVMRLAMRLNPRYGRALTDESKARLAEVRNQIQARYTQRRRIHVEPGALQTNRASYGRPVDPYNPGFGN